MTTLKGITWDHSRGFTSAVASAQRFHELHPEIDVVWQKRSLLDFGEYPVERLVDDYDLMIIDHPFIGHAAHDQLFLPLDNSLSNDILSRFKAGAIGQSYESYNFDGKQWALPVDTACPVAAWRDDLLEQHQVELPKNWSELIAMAAAGRVLYPGIPTDAIHHFFMLCHALQGNLFATTEALIEQHVAETALNMLQELADASPPECQQLDPIQVLDVLSSSDQFTYCPFAFFYFNYGIRGYSQHRLNYGRTFPINGRPTITTLGGCGIAVSRSCVVPEIASDYCAFVASEATQGGLYAYAGGQPAQRSAWLDEDLNRHTGGSFQKTLDAHECAWMRPRYHGYLHFQDNACHTIYQCQKKEIPIPAAISELNRIYRESLKINKHSTLEA